jgi:competence ComEA-like helix-hairpin-helix protein
LITLTDLQHRFGFTRNEVVLILFLSVSLLAGAGIRMFRADISGGAEIPASSFYASSDSEFAALSSAAGSGDSATGAPHSGRVFPRKPIPPAASVDINTATRGELTGLPGIGDAYADRIISFRQEHGRFSRINDLMRVPGIGRKRFEALRPFITVR